MTTMQLFRCCKLSALLRTSTRRCSALRRAHRACHASAADGDAKPGTTARKIVFLGTPQVAAEVLRTLHDASRTCEPQFEISAIVTQPPRAKGRGSKSVRTPCPVHEAALHLGFDQDLILTPEKAREEAFLDTLRQLAPDLCVTAAYGNMLPQAFLDIPRCGTLNIHPSLLPLYRGAAPVPRALQDGVTETGVSVAFTVLRCDAGPILAQKRVAVDPEEQAPALLDRLFAEGAQLLVQHLPDVWAGRGPTLAWAQDDAAATHAAKLSKEESPLDCSQPALTLHNKVRAFAPWPGTTMAFRVQDPATGKEEAVELKVLRTRVAAAEQLAGVPQEEVGWSEGGMLVPCGGGTVLELLEVQPPKKKAYPAREYKNGLGKKRLLVARPAVPAAV